MLIRINDTFHPIVLSALYTPHYSKCRKQNAVCKSLKRIHLLGRFLIYWDILKKIIFNAEFLFQQDEFKYNYCWLNRYFKILKCIKFN